MFKRLVYIDYCLLKYIPDYNSQGVVVIIIFVLFIYLFFLGGGDLWVLFLCFFPEGGGSYTQVSIIINRFIRRYRVRQATACERDDQALLEGIV